MGAIVIIMSLELFAQTIQKVEGYYAPGENPAYPDGTLAWRNNNPGNLIYTDYYARHFGAVPGAGKYSRFADYATGYAALKHQIQLDAARGLTIAQMMEKYAPSSDGNNPSSYAATIANALGVSVNTPVQWAIDGHSQVPVPTMNPAIDASFYVPVLIGALALALWISSD